MQFVWLGLVSVLLSLTAHAEDTKHAVTEESLKEAIGQFQQMQGKRPPGESDGEAMIRRLWGWDEKENKEEKRLEALKALDGNQLLEKLVENIPGVLKELQELSDGSFKLLGLNKKAFDSEADEAIRKEMGFWLAGVRRLVRNIDEDNIDTPEVKTTLANLLARLNSDRVLAAYGRQMMVISSDPKLSKADLTTNRLRAILKMQHEEAAHPTLVKGLVTEVGKTPLYPASHAGAIGEEAIKTLFSVKEEQVDADLLLLGQDLIFKRHVQGMINLK